MIHLAVRRLLDQPGVGIALWGARHPGQLDAINCVLGWTIDEEASRTIDAVLTQEIGTAIGPEFMAPP